MSHRGRALLIALGLVLASGCAGGVSPPDRHYRVEAPKPAAPLAKPLFPGTLVIQVPRSDAVLAGRPLVYRESRDALELHRRPYALWSDTPTRMLQQEIAKYLRAAGVAERVVTTDLRIEGDAMLTAHLERLEQILERPASVELVLEVAVLQGRDRALSFHRVYRREHETPSKNVEDAVAAFGSALGEILDQFVRDAAEALSGPPVP